MELLNTFALVLVTVLAIWKLYELCFPKKQNEASMVLLLTFCADLLYKQSTHSDRFVPAPASAYKEVLKTFRIWLKERNLMGDSVKK